ncbi:hypothetical protein PPERSA_01694 [Pseudocohnilembus persalinus]|uniref:Leucine zipper transcription factor-like protein 1 n=1 Tax=Pseudocohnilembus persalinus TaxID=266149 RepID=A0A0V0R1X4_PSEPJ|nr:hypothetical protein PPERSA_01694 [Pseudocohnilembus persalinus]|eukprot:KRX08149.1 hypothetical protein PPERSA_01694 [Pseudocohnilembus persalinus]
MNSSASLNETHIQELQKLLGFFRNKRQETVEDIEPALKEFISDNISDETLMYNKDDVLNLLQKFALSQKTAFEQDLAKTARMGGVYVKLLMLEAQKSDITFQANTDLIEDIRLIDIMKQIEIGEGFKVENLEEKLKNANLHKRGSNKLQSMQSQKLQEGDQDLQKKIQELENEIKSLKSGQDKQTNLFGNDEKNQLLNEIEDLKQKIHDMESEYEGVKSDLDKKLNESTQVNNLKKMMQQKNKQLKELKEELAQCKKE